MRNSSFPHATINGNELNTAERIDRVALPANVRSAWWASNDASFFSSCLCLRTELASSGIGVMVPLDRRIVQKSKVPEIKYTNGREAMPHSAKWNYNSWSLAAELKRKQLPRMCNANQRAEERPKKKKYCQFISRPCIRCSSCWCFSLHLTIVRRNQKTRKKNAKRVYVIVSTCANSSCESVILINRGKRNVMVLHHSSKVIVARARALSPQQTAASSGRDKVFHHFNIKTLLNIWAANQVRCQLWRAHGNDSAYM